MKNNILFALKNKQFTYLILAEIFTQIPVNILNFLLILVIFNLTKSNTAVSIVVLSFTLPAVFLGILAGIYTDKWNKKEVLLLTNIIRVALLIVLMVFPENIYVIYLISFLFGIVTQFFIPAETPLIPLIVDKNHLLSANALFGVGIFGSILAAYVLSGPLLLYSGFTTSLMIMAISLGIGGFFVSKIRVPIEEEMKSFRISKQFPINAVKQEMRDILSYIVKNTHILGALLLLALTQILFLIIAAIAPGFANEVLHIRVEEFPLLVIAPATVGIIVGAIFIANILYLHRKKNIITAGILLASIVLMIMPFGNDMMSNGFISALNQKLPDLLVISSNDLIIFLAFLLGFANALVYVPANTLLQETTSESIRGTLYGALNSFVGILSFMPILLVGSFSDLIGVGSVVMGIGICLFLLSIGKILLRY